MTDVVAYTKADQRADTAFLVGTRYGREAERAELDARLADPEAVEAVARAVHESTHMEPDECECRPDPEDEAAAAAALAAVRGLLGEEA